MDDPTPAQASTDRTNTRATVGMMTLLALGLRLWGITWGLPNREHLYSYHPDEILVLAASHSADLWHGGLNPHFFNYGSLTIYLISLFRPLAYALLAPSLYSDYLLGRFLTALFGAGTVILVYLLARRIAGSHAAIIAGLALSIAPEHVMHSHYVTVDVPATFWVTLCLYACIAGPSASSSGRWNAGRWALLAGAAAGLAAGTKYNAGLVLLAALVAFCHRAATPDVRNPDRLTLAVKVVGAFIVAFLLSTPGFLLWPTQFWHDFGYELEHTRTGHGLVFMETAPGFIYHWATNLRWGLGLPMLLLVTAALITAIIRLCQEHRKSDPSSSEINPYLILLLFAVPYYLLIGAAQVKFQRYTIPMLPALFVLLGAEATRVLGRWGRGAAAAGWGILALVGAYTLAYTVAFDGLFNQVPPQDQAAIWLRANALGRTVGLTTVPWFYSPPVSPYNAGPQSKREFLEHSAESPFRLSIVGTDAGPDVGLLEIADPKYLILSDFETADPLRLMKDPRTGGITEVVSFVRFWEAVRSRYVPAVTFRITPSPAFPGLFPGGEPPHDWHYPYPEITIWKRK